MPEAMACGLPVITTPFLGLPDEFGVAGVHYALSGWETDILTDDIRRFLANEQHRQRLGSKARRWVVENLDVNHSLDQYAAFYRDVVGQSRQKRLRIA